MHKTLLALLLLIPLFTAFTPTNGLDLTGLCTASNQVCDQIVFDQSFFGNFTNISGLGTIVSTPLTFTLNETIVIVAGSNIGGSVTSITDTGPDTFTRQTIISQGCTPCQNLEIWTAKTTIATGTVSTITVNWNDSMTNNAFVGATYLNVASIGNSTSANLGIPGSNSGSISIIPVFSGSKIVGGTGLAPTTANQNSIVPGNFMTKRADACSKTGGGGFCDIELAVQDNMTVLRNTQSFTYSSSWPNQASSAAQMSAIELVGFDKEPSFPNFNNFCTTTNLPSCPPTYFINYATTNTRPNALNQALALNTAYCTGLTSKALTTTKSDNIFGWADWGGISLNVTNLKMLIQYYITTTAPSTTFGAGLCSVGATLSGTFTDQFSRSGTSLNATNAFPISMSACLLLCTNNATAGTYYAFVEITPLNFSSGHVNFDQICNQVYSECGIWIQEEK